MRCGEDGAKKGRDDWPRRNCDFEPIEGETRPPKATHANAGRDEAHVCPLAIAFLTGDRGSTDLDPLAGAAKDAPSISFISP